MAILLQKGNIQMIKANLIFRDGEPFVQAGGLYYRARIGGGGIRQNQVEGDQATPVGTLLLRKIFYRADRMKRPQSGAGLLIEPLSPRDGWCDDPNHADYNQQVLLPHEASCETLWRADHAYDICVVLGWNDQPPVPGKGSAIFLHLPPTKGYTEGCIALEEADLRELLSKGLVSITVSQPSIG